MKSVQNEHRQLDSLCLKHVQDVNAELVFSLLVSYCAWLLAVTAIDWDLTWPVCSARVNMQRRPEQLPVSLWDRDTVGTDVSENALSVRKPPSGRRLECIFCRNYFCRIAKFGVKIP